MQLSNFIKKNYNGGTLVNFRLIKVIQVRKYDIDYNKMILQS